MLSENAAFGYWNQCYKKEDYHSYVIHMSEEKNSLSQDVTDFRMLQDDVAQWSGFSF